MNNPETTPAARATLEFSSGERVVLTDLCSIGRNPGSQIVIDNEKVSRRHAVIRRVDDATYELMDMGSSNGTYLGGARIDRPVILKDGQVIEIGLQRMTFHLPATGPRPDPARTTGEGWLLVVEAALRGARLPTDHYSEKTVESWNERCHRVITSQRGTPVRAMKEGLLAYWRAGDAKIVAPAVAATLRSLRAVQKTSEEFRFALHYGPMTFREDEGPAAKPGGDAVIYALQLQRLVSLVDTSVLISTAAHQHLAKVLPLRPLTRLEMREKGGADTFYTLQE